MPYVHTPAWRANLNERVKAAAQEPRHADVLRAIVSDQPWVKDRHADPA